MNTLKMLLISLVMFSLLVLSGCAGRAAYEAEPMSIDGKIVCCKISIDNTKDIELVDVQYESSADGSTKLSIKEKGVKTNAAVAAENQGKLLDAVTSIIPKVE